MNLSLFFSLRRKLLTPAACILFISGCTSLQPVNVALKSERVALSKGDTVVITTTGGETHTFKLVDITADGVHGRELSVPYSDIRLLQIRRVDMRKTLLLTAGAIGVGAVISNNDGDGGGGY